PSMAFQVGGPAAGVLLIVAGGYYLPPTPPSSFDLILRLTGPDPVSELAAGATADVSAGRRSQRLEFGKNGEAFWPGLPSSARDTDITIQFYSPKYVPTQKSDRYKVAGDDIVVIMLAKKPSQ